MVDPGGGSRGSGPPSPIRPDACLRLKFLHWQDHISLFNWLIFLLKCTIHFATILSSRDIKNVIVFGYPPMICSPLITKQYFPCHRLRNKWSSLRSNLPQKSSTVPSAPKFGPPQSKIPGSAPDMPFHTFRFQVLMHQRCWKEYLNMSRKQVGAPHQTIVSRMSSFSLNKSLSNLPI